MTKRYLDRTLLKTLRPNVEEIYVPEWGIYVRVRGLTGRERDQFESSLVSVNGRSTTLRVENVRARLVALTVVDENGERLFRDDEIDEIGQLDARGLDRIFQAALRLSGLSANSIEEITQNFT